MESAASSPTELQLGPLYGRYRHWRSPPPPPSDAPMEDASNQLSAPAPCALVVQFEATALEDLRVGFAPSLEVSNESSEDDERHKKPHIDWKYEVAVGTSGNTELVWRKSASGRTKEVDLARVFTGRTCSTQDFVAYWVVVDVKSGALSFGVGAQVGEDVLSTVQDPEFVHVTQTAFTSWDSPVSIRGIQVHGVYEGQTEVLAAANIAAFPPPRPMVRADPLGKEDLLTSEQRQQYEAEYAASKRRAERFGAPFAPPDIKKFLDPREVRKLQRSGAIVPGFSTGIDITSQEEQSKREQRMKRFDTPQFAVEYTAETAKALEQGMTQEEWAEKQRDQEKLRARAQKFGLSAEEDHSNVVPTGIKAASAKVRRERYDVKAPVVEGQSVLFRDDALHMYSLDEKFQQVRTIDVMEYFVGYGPAYVEWFNDSSCTIVFQDNFTAARALIALSQEIPPQTLKQKKEKTEDASALVEDVDMADAEASADDAAMAMEVEEEVEVPDVEFNRSQWHLGNPIGSQTQPRDKKWRVLLRKATDDDFPPEKLPKKGTYHSRDSQRHDSRGSRRRNDREYGSSSRRRGGDSRAHPYGEFREDRRGEEPSGRRRRNKNDDRDTGKPSKRIRVNADGSINIVRDEQAASSEAASASKPASVPKSEPAPAVE
ncbi:Nuclear cap-binding protein subunit 3 [Phytophthora infestans]|uniref:Nuclear cap-binding protein subunit 3 n=1 Tax=Phytophthora infestans TaxID=4787 RepID=A0A8S9V7T2_PHYIN|nr:Nuclear cap-binding protein subunit 3 [Phytophthora infestans]